MTTNNPLAPLDLAETAKSLAGPWSSEMLSSELFTRTQLRAMENYTAPWHTHADGAEAFLVIEGHFWMDLESGPIKLEQGQWLVVPPGTSHRARAEQRVVLLVLDGFAAR